MGIGEKLETGFALLARRDFDALAPLLQEVLAEAPDLFGAHYLAGMYHCECADNARALVHFDRAVEISPTDINARIIPVFRFPDLSKAGGESSRDRLLYVIDHLHAQLVQSPNYHLVLRYAARYCHLFNRTDRVPALYAELTGASGAAEDYYEMASNETVQAMDLDAAYAALQKAMSLQPEKYDTDINRNTASLLRSKAQGKSAVKNKVHRVKYPRTDQFRGDIYTLISNSIANEHKHSAKFINKQTRFFTIGSCFAVNIYKTLIAHGYQAECMWLADNFNTTFANRHLADWLQGTLNNPDIEQRIRELSIDIDSGLEKHDREHYLKQISNADVFIMTLGVAAAFFTESGEFVMPRPSELHMRALNEHYQFKTSTVAQNVENVNYVIRTIRKLAPDIKIVLTVSPVPLHATFEFESAVVADCLSKSVMRLTAHEVTTQSGFENVFYWPSFEVFRWAGSNAGPFYAGDDNDALHVSKFAVDANIRSFIDLFSEPNPGA